MSKILKRGIRLTTALVCSVALFLAGAFIVPKPFAVSSEEPDPSFNIISFSNFGIADGLYTPDSNEDYEAQGTFTDNFDKKYFVGTVRIDGNSTILYLGGTEAGKGLSFNLSLKNLAVKYNDGQSKTIKATDAGVGSTFKGTQFNLGVTFEKLSDNKLKVGIWINGNHIAYYEFTGVTTVGNTVSIKCANNMYIASDSSAKALPDKTLDWLTLSHFYLNDATYGYNNGSVAATGKYPLNLLNTYFKTKVTFSATEGASIFYAGKNDAGMDGLRFTLSGGKLKLEDALDGNKSVVLPKEFDAVTAEVVPSTAPNTFANVEFALGISMVLVDGNADGLVNDIKLGIWFNDTLYENEYIYLQDAVDRLGSALSFYSHINGSTVKIGTIADLAVTMPSKDLTFVTFDQFSIGAAKYTGANGVQAKGLYEKEFDNLFFDGTVKFQISSSAASPILSFGYKGQNAINGLCFSVPTTTTMVLKSNGSSSAETLAVFSADIAGLERFTDKFRLGISYVLFDKDGDGVKDDVKLGVYFNENLYGEYELQGYKDKLGVGMGIHTLSTSVSLTVESIEEFKTPIASRPMPNYNRITLDTIYVDDGIYKNNGSTFAITGDYNKSFDGLAFGVNVTFTGSDNKLYYAADKTKLSSGIRFEVSTNGDRLTISDPRSTENKAFGQFDIVAEKAGLTDFYQNFDLAITTKFVDNDNDGEKDDLELGVWINGILYKDEYHYSNDYVKYMSKSFAYYSGDTTQACFVELKSIESFKPEFIAEKLNPNLKKISLFDFGIEDGVSKINGNDFDKKGNVTSGLKNTYLIFNIKVNQPTANPTAFAQYGGTPWGGIQFSIRENEIDLRTTSGSLDTLSIKPKTVGLTTFLGVKYKMGISIEYLDLDKDGAEDDLKAGIWINDKLGNNEYLEVLNYAPKMNAWLGFYTNTEGYEYELEGINIPIDFARFGFTTNWAQELNIHANMKPNNKPTNSNSNSNSGSSTPTSPQTGEQARGLSAMVVSCVALGGLLKDTNKRAKGTK